MTERLSRLSLRLLAAALGSTGIFLLWASFYAHTLIEASLSIVLLGAAAVIVFAMAEDVL